MAEVRDLDVLKPEQVMFRLNGELIDVSFVPTGLTFDINDVVAAMAKIDQKKVTKGDRDELKKAFELGVDLCVAFCAWKHPEMDRAWFMEYTVAPQVRLLGEAVQEALTRSYAGIDSKNAEATENPES